MSQLHARRALLRTRWSAIGAAVAVTLGAGGLSMAQAAIDTGDRPVTISIAAERILDTRTDLGLPGRFADGAPRDLQVTGSVPTASGGSKTVVPADAVGVLVNVTVVTPTHEGFLSLRPQGATGDPTTSTVNFTPGSIEPNGATVDLNNGQIQIWVETASDTGTADVLIDVVGYTIGHTHDDRYYTESESDAAHAALETQIGELVGTASNAGTDQPDLAIGTYTDLAEVNFSVFNDGAVTISTSVSLQLETGISVRCRIVLDGASLTESLDQSTGGFVSTTVGLTAGAGLSAGAHTATLQCQQDNGATAVADAFNPTITLVYSATPL